MICKICGSDIMEGLKTCPKCWSPVEPLVPEKQRSSSVLRPVLIVVSIAIIGLLAFLFISSLSSDKDTSSKSSHKSKTTTEAFAEYTFPDDETSEEYNEYDNLKKVQCNQPFSVDGIFKITLLSAEWDKEIRPSNTSGNYSCIELENGKKYFIARAKVKNITNKIIDPADNIKCSLTINNEYSLEGNVAVESSSHRDFNGTIEPLQENNVVMYIPVPDDVFEQYKEATLHMQFYNNKNAIGVISDSDSDFDFFYASFVK